MTSRHELRLIAPLLALGALLLVSGGAFAWYLHRLHSETAERLTRSVAILDAVEVLSQRARQVEVVIVERTSSDSPLPRSDLESLENRLLGSLDDAERHSPGDPESRLLARIRNAWQQFFDECRAAGHAGSGGITDVARVFMKERIDPQIREPLRALLERARSLVLEASNESQTTSGRLAKLSLVLGGVGALGGLLAGFAVARIFRRSIIQLSIPIRDAAGKLDEAVGPVEVSTASGVNEIEHALDKISSRVSEVVAKLRRTEREAMRSQQLAAIGQLAAGMAHEILNPLTAMKMIVQSAQEHRENVGGRDLSVLNDEILRQERAIRGFLDFARPPSPRRRPFDLREAVERTIELVSARAGKQRVRIETRLPGGEVIVPGDAEHIRQVLLNLLLNALDALGTGGEIRLSLEKNATGAHATDSVRIRISDSGPGLEPGSEERVFEPFFSTKPTGTGLGLSICRRIVEDHGGRIVAENGENGGAVFTVDLPCTSRNPAESTDSSRPSGARIPESDHAQAPDN